MKIGKFIFGLSLFNFIYWILVNSFDMYEYAVLGAIYEMLWLMMIFTAFTLPLISLGLWIRQKSPFASWHFYSLLIQAALLLYIYFLAYG